MNLKAYLDGALSPAETAEVERALAADPALREELRQLQALGDSLRAYAPNPVPVGMEETLLALTASRRPRPIWSRLALLGTGALAVLAIALTVNRSPGTEATFAAKSDSAPMAAMQVESAPTEVARMADKVRTTAPYAVQTEAVLETSDPKALEAWSRRNAGAAVRDLPSGTGSVITIAPEELEPTVQSLQAFGTVEIRSEARQLSSDAKRQIEENLPRYRERLAALQRSRVSPAQESEILELRDQIAVAEAQLAALGDAPKAVLTVRIASPVRPSSTQTGP